MRQSVDERHRGIPGGKKFTTRCHPRTGDRWVLHAQGSEQLQRGEHRDDAGVGETQGQCPKLLADKQNAATLHNVLDPALSVNTVLTEELRAFGDSTPGGAKTCALAGAVFNNKNDKKGEADKTVDVMTKNLTLDSPTLAILGSVATRTPPPIS